MRMTSVRVLVVLCALLMASAVGYAWGRTQVATEPVAPSILTGSDIGFRLTGRQGERAVGTIVVRINGQWVPIASEWNPKPAR